MRKLIFTLAAMTLMTTACTTKQQTTGIDLANLDTTAVPQNDFYQFACGGWMANNPLTPEYSRFGSFDKLGLQNLEQVNGLIQDIAAKKHPQGSIAQKIGDIYNLAMDTARRDQEGIAPVQKILDEIDDSDYLQVLKPLLKSKEKSIKANSDYERKIKLMKFAIGRGFTMNLIRQCIDGIDDED